MVGSKDKEGIVVPWLGAGAAEEVSQRVVAITDAFMDGMGSLGEGVAVLLGHFERLVGRGGEDSGAERLRLTV